MYCIVLYCIVSGSYRLRAVIIYPVSANVFFVELSDHMESIILSPEKLVIMADSNTHVDVAGDMDANKQQDSN